MEQKSVRLEDIDIDGLATELADMALPEKHLLAALSRAEDQIFAALSDLGISRKIAQAFGEKKRADELLKRAEETEKRRQLVQELKSRLTSRAEDNDQAQEGPA